jgi:hypothetical protein
LWILTQMMALALAPRIRVNGSSRPDVAEPRQSIEHHRSRSRMPLQRGTSPAETGAALRFILAPRQ